MKVLKTLSIRSTRSCPLAAVVTFLWVVVVVVADDMPESCLVPPNISIRAEAWVPPMTSFHEKAVMACCDTTKANWQPAQIGSMPQFRTDQAWHVLDVAKIAWHGGTGVWPQMTLQQRIQAVEHFLQEIQAIRENIVHVLMWEIGKNRPDAESEFDRTLRFARDVLQVLRDDPQYSGTTWQELGNVKALVRRGAIGVWMLLAPFNYPLNECYAALIPALLMGNVCILKIPTVGGLVHLLTLQAAQTALPPGTLSFIAGSGRATMPPLMQSGHIDGLAFIGGSKAADALIRDHPHPHRLKLFLQLEANNMGILLPDVFTDPARLEHALRETITGTISYNGQRCTALKLLFVPKSRADTFVNSFVKRLEALSIGMPWQQHADGAYSKLTPLPNAARIDYMHELIEDALAKGAQVVNAHGGTIVGGPNSTLMVPAVLYPVTSDMKVYAEEQFGPVIPVAVYDDDDVQPILDFARDSPYGQQVSIFGQDEATIRQLTDHFGAIFARINYNTQCSRGPDTLPFAGRRSSALGVMSVTDALREVSIPTVLAYKVDNDTSDALRAHRNLPATVGRSNFLQAVQ